MISLLVVMRDGKAIETATVGRQGVVGAMSLDLHTSKLRAIAQLPMHASRLLASQLRTAAVSSKPIVELCIRYNEVLLDRGLVQLFLSDSMSGVSVSYSL